MRFDSDGSHTATHAKSFYLSIIELAIRTLRTYINYVRVNQFRVRAAYVVAKSLEIAHTKATKVLECINSALSPWKLIVQHSKN